MTLIAVNALMVEVLQEAYKSCLNQLKQMVDEIEDLSSKLEAGEAQNDELKALVDEYVSKEQQRDDLENK